MEPMSKLGDALAAWDKQWPYGPQKKHESVIVEAARLVANPDYKAGWHWAIQHQAMSLEFATGIINAALGITEET